MRKLGLIGGMSWYSTRTYYEMINRLVMARAGKQANAPLLIESLDYSELVRLSSDEDWAREITAAAERTGELVWRMPLHAEYSKAIEGRYADIVNSPADRGAGSATAAEFLKRFVGDVPWAHLDIAGTAYDLGRPYASKGGAGWGVRLLVELARGEPAAPDLH